jgi:hypothetical protein
MPKFFIPEPLPGLPPAPWFASRDHALFNESLPENFFETAERVSRPEDADAIVLQNNFRSADGKSREYIARYAELGQRFGIPVYAFSLGDYTDGVAIDPRVTVFTLSLYRSSAQQNSVSMPTLVDDIGREGAGIRPRAAIPTVSFCGKADFKDTREAISSWVKRIAHMFNAPARIRGVFWRRWMIRACSASSAVKTSFIVRKGFSGALKTIDLPPEQARKEFIENMRESDFVLAPKGDGNYSNRFLEALSMGRIPVVADTDIVLPLEDAIDYARIVVRVPMSRVKDTPAYIRDFYDSLSEEEWAERQKAARQVFEKHLRQDSFFRTYFSSRGV